MRLNHRALICLALANWTVGSANALATVFVTTTIYVGSHFEVRDHDQPTKYVFNGATRVAEVTGSLSTNLRVQRLRLCSGWNLCSVAVTGPFPADGAAAISAVYQWNQPTRDYSPVSLGQNLAAGTVLWISAKTNVTSGVLGVYSDPATEAVPGGGGYLAASGLEAWALNLPPTLFAWLYDSPAGQWDAQLPGDLAPLSDLPSVLSPGQAFYARSDTPVQLAPTDLTLRIRYYHQDHLGSSSVITDNAGGLVEETAFSPFGVFRNRYRPRQVDEPFEFTQKERDRESGLNYFEARYLTTGLSRFATVDSKYIDPGELSTEELSSLLSDPQELNLYGYVRNSPLIHVDPTGFGYCDMEPYAYDCQEARDFEDPPSVGQQVQVLGGMAEAATGWALCDTVIGCVVGGPMMAHGVDNIQAGVRGTPTLTAQHLGTKVDFAMNVLPVAVGAVNAIRGLASGGATLAAGGAGEAGTIRAGAANTATAWPETIYATPEAAAKTWPGAGVGLNKAAVEVARANARNAQIAADWKAAVNSTPRDAWIQATIDATRDYRYMLPLSEQPAALRAIIETAYQLFH